MTSIKNKGERHRGDWGGLIMKCSGKRLWWTSNLRSRGEAFLGKYGGDKFSDNSGKLRYVRVEFAGHEYDMNNRLNGITFMGVGSGTTVEFVQSHMSYDDGVQFFGGSVDAKNLVISGARADSLAWGKGWQGRIQYLWIQQDNDFAGNGIEGENMRHRPDASPRSHPIISNATIVASVGAGKSSIFLHRGTGLDLYNSLLINAGTSGFCLNIDDESTVMPHLNLDNNLLYCVNPFNTGSFSYSEMKPINDPKIKEGFIPLPALLL